MSQIGPRLSTAIDSLVYINNLNKNGAGITLSAEGQTATYQIASAGWGGLYGQQGMGFYLLWKANKVTDFFLNKTVDLGAGTDKTRREQWIEVFRESFDAGLTYSGRRYITNQLMESAHSVYGAALALYALDPQTYHNAPKLGLRLMREAVGIDEWTGVPKNALFDGSIKDADGYPTYELGDPDTPASGTNYWGHHFHAITAKGNGREQGWTCTSCYGNIAGRISDMYIATLQDPFIGTTAVDDPKKAGDQDILQVAVNNTKTQGYFTYPTVDSKGFRSIIGESSMCWRNRYDPGRNFYASLMCGALSDDEEILGRVLQAYKEGHFDPDTSGRLFPYYTNSYFLSDAIDKLIDYAAEHDADYKRMPSTSGEPDYVMGDPQDCVMAVKHGNNYLFVNFMAEDNPLESGMAHIITPTNVKSISFAPEVFKYYSSGQYYTLPDVYWNGNHKITYPDNPQMANGGMQYERPAYDASGNYNSARPQGQYYQQLLGQYLIAQNCSENTDYPLVMNETINGLQAIDIATGRTVTLSASIQLAAGETKAYYIDALAGGSLLSADNSQQSADTEALKTRVAELLAFAQTASANLSDDKAPGTYGRSAFMPFFRELTMAAYIANCGTATAEEVTAETTALETAYQTFLASQLSYDACEVPGRLDYTKKVATTGSVTVSKTAMSNAKSGAQVFVPVKAAEEGDYMVSVKAKGHVADQYKPSLNIDVLTSQQHYDGSKAVDDSRTQVIAYNDFDYTVYKWTIHLKANDAVLLRYVFGGTSTAFTVDVSTTEIAAVTAADLLAAEVTTAQTLLDSYEGSDLVSDAARQAFATAIAAAKAVSDNTETTVDQAQEAYDTLLAAEETFRAAVTELETHVLDLDNALYTNAAKHTLKWPDGTKGIALRTNAWNKLYVGRYDISKVRQIKVRTNIKSHIQYCYGLRAYAVPVSAVAGTTTAAVTTTDQLNALSTSEDYRIGTFYGDETIGDEALKEGNNTWKVGPQRIFDMQKKTITANEADFRSLWGETAVVPTTGYTYEDDTKATVTGTYETAWNTSFLPTEGLCDIYFQYGASKWGEMTVDEVIVEAFKSQEEPEVFDGTFRLMPSKDLALRIGNSQQSGTGAAIEVRENTANNHEYGFSGIMEFDLTAVQQKMAEGWKVGNVTLRLTDCSNNRSSKLAIRPFWSGWAEDKATTYDANADYIKSAIAAGDALTTVQLGRYGGKKAFELQGASTQVNPFPVSSYQGTSEQSAAFIKYIADSLAAGKTAISVLIGRDDDLSTQGSGFYTKDVLTGLTGTGQCSQYQWSDADSKWVAIDGTDNSITRIAAAKQFFGLTDAEFLAACTPLLTITMTDPGEAPAEMTTYTLSTKWNDTDLYLNVPSTEGGAVVLSDKESQVKIGQKGSGYVVANKNGYYLTYTDANNWDLVATASYANATIFDMTLEEGLMTLKSDNGYVGINTKTDVAAGEPVYGDCNPTGTHKVNFAYQWTAAEVEDEPVIVVEDFTVDGINYHVTSQSAPAVEVAKYGETKYAGKVEIPATVTYADKTYTVTAFADGALDDCDEMTALAIPATITTLSSTLTSGCTSLQSITVDADNASYASSEGVLYNKDLTTLVTYPNKDAEDYTLPEGVTAIGDYAFAGNTNMKYARLGSEVARLGQQVFNRCTQLDTVYVDAVTPPAVTATAGVTPYAQLGSGVGGVNIRVAKGCGPVYRLATPWCYFNIVDEADDEEEGPATGIWTVNSAASDAQRVIYDMSGRKVQEGHLKKGLYIVNGRKVVIK